MPRAPTKNLHVPLPAPLYERLRQAAREDRRPATTLARQAIDRWLAERQRNATHRALAAYARQNAGGPDDLDPSLEAAATEHLLARPPETDGQEQP